MTWCHVIFAWLTDSCNSLKQCALALATSCGYPAGYFDDLSQDNDEILEIERNDVRDVIRSVSSLESGNFGSNEHKSPSILILERIMAACYNSIHVSDTYGPLPPETAVHTLSALAKPLNKMAKRYAEQSSATECTLMTMSLEALGSVCERVNSAFDFLPLSKILPVSRLALMGMASLSPLFSTLAEISLRQYAIDDAGKQLMVAFEKTLRLSLQCSILSAANIPELIAESTLLSTRYDIKGAMRGPGGEDHGMFSFSRRDLILSLFFCADFKSFPLHILRSWLHRTDEVIS